MTTEADRVAFATAGSPQYLEATSSYNLGYVLRPSSALVAHDVDEVRAAVRETAAAGQKLIPISTGHAASMVSPDEEVRLIRTALEDAIEIDDDRGIATFPAGTKWNAVVEAAAKSGWAVPHGSSGTVGAVGYLLGGGMSFYGRTIGVAANGVDSLRIVTADGDEHHVDAEHDRELFWALRGGGGGFGVVTSMSVRMRRLSEIVTGMIVWPAEHAENILTAWREWTLTAPRTVTTSLRLLTLPPLPGLPPALVSGQVIAIDGASAHEDIAVAERDATEMLDRLKAVAEPTLDTWHTGPASDLPMTHADPPEPVPSAGDSFSVEDFDEAAAAAWIGLAGPGGSTQVVAAELRQLGGAFREPSENGGAYDHIDADVLVVTIDLPSDPSLIAETEEKVLGIRAGMAPYVGRWTSPTLVETPTSPRRTFASDVEERVDAIRHRVDPDGVFALDARPSIDAP